MSCLTICRLPSPFFYPFILLSSLSVDALVLTEIALEMFHARELSIPCQQSSLLISKESLNIVEEELVPSCKYTPAFTG